jgi:hypothetical protein
MGDGEREPERDSTGGLGPPEGAAPGAGDEMEPAGVFGGLPRSRPGRRSPRRAPATTEAAAEEEEEEEEEARGGPPPEPPGGPGGESAEQPVDVESGPDSAGSPAGQRGLDDLVWASVAIAAEAATLGIRLANRALEKMSGDAERR